jgi:farnesyl-diphosphate farnesyltransferase
MTDEQYQEYILPAVSRTFALTIPQLPVALRKPVGTAYLLCRIADTIEDEPGLTVEQKHRFASEFVSVVAGVSSAETFSKSLSTFISPHTQDAERDLVINTARVIRLLTKLTAARRSAISRCVEIMANGMARFQSCKNPLGLKNVAELDSYCYHVAGVVGEMLTELYCDYSPAVRTKRTELLTLAVSFGQGLQMTNILKDFWEDRRRGACWLSQDVFLQNGHDPTVAGDGEFQKSFGDSIGAFVAIAHSHLRNGLTYTLTIPREERGLRKFCFWALGMAVLTLRQINRNRAYTSATQVKISRRGVRAISFLANRVLGGETLPRLLFEALAKGLPMPSRAAHDQDSNRQPDRIYPHAGNLPKREAAARRNAP